MYDASRSCRTLAGSTLPVSEIVAAANNRPSSIDPESPMKIRAGLKLWGRNPAQNPIKCGRDERGRAEDVGS